MFRAELLRKLWNWRPEEIERSVSKFKDPQTVGVVEVLEVIGSEEDEFDRVVLDIKGVNESDRSGVVDGVPCGWFISGSRAEVIVQKYKGSEEPDWREREILKRGGFYCVAVRPYDPEIYGNKVRPLDPIFQVMFDRNVKAPQYAKGFHKLFIKYTR
jgi:hypothetical protein